MKRIMAIMLAVMLVVSLSACNIAGSPVNKLNDYIIKNGEKNGEQYVLVCPEAIEKIKESDFTIAHMENLKATAEIEFKLIKDESGVSVELLDSSITNNGIKMERTVLISPDGTFKYYNGLVMNGTDLGVHLEGEIPVSTYNKENTPVITKSQLAPGAKLSDAVTSALKDYIDLTLDCYSMVISQEKIGITMADVGYSAYSENK